LLKLKGEVIADRIKKNRQLKDLGDMFAVLHIKGIENGTKVLEGHGSGMEKFGARIRH